MFPYIQNYKFNPSLINNPDTTNYQDNLSDDETFSQSPLLSSITPPPSSSSKPPPLSNSSHDFNDFDTSKFSSNYDDLQYDDMQENPLYISSQPQSNNQNQIYPRVADTNHSFFPQSPITNTNDSFLPQKGISCPFDDKSLRQNKTPYNLRKLPYTNYSKTRYSFPPD